MGKSDSCVDVQHKKRGRPKICERSSPAAEATSSSMSASASFPGQPLTYPGQVLHYPNGMPAYVYHVAKPGEASDSKRPASAPYSIMTPVPIAPHRAGEKPLQQKPDSTSTTPPPLIHAAAGGSPGKTLSGLSDSVDSIADAHKAGDAVPVVGSTAPGLQQQPQASNAYTLHYPSQQLYPQYYVLANPQYPSTAPYLAAYTQSGSVVSHAMIAPVTHVASSTGPAAALPTPVSRSSEPFAPVNENTVNAGVPNLDGDKNVSRCTEYMVQR